MLRFLYTGNYEDESVGEHRTETNLRVHELAEKYDISTLKQLAKHKFEKHVSELDNDQFTKVVEDVYTTTPSSDRGLRDCLGEIICNRKNDLRGHDGFIELIRHRLDGDFAFDLINTWCSTNALISSNGLTLENIFLRCPCSVGRNGIGNRFWCAKCSEYRRYFRMQSPACSSCHGQVDPRGIMSCHACGSIVKTASLL